jgi:hypothetical protein
MTPLDDKYQQLGGSSGFLGAPATEELVCPDGVGHFRHFQGGSIYWTPGTGAWEVHGAIRAKWESLGWELSFLGYPLTDECTTPDGVGRYNHFQAGSIYWTPDTGAWEAHGAIRDKWASLGWETSFLGYPLTDECTTPDGVGRYNHFQGGSIYWTADTGACEVHGAIRAKWESLGWERSFLGYPITDECTTPDGLGRYNHFQGNPVTTGAVVLHRYYRPDAGDHFYQTDPSSTPSGYVDEGIACYVYPQQAAGTVALHRYYRPDAGDHFYQTDPSSTPSGYVDEGIACYVYAEKLEGSIYWTPATGAHEVHGAIRDLWASLGWELSWLGYPTSDVRPTADGVGRYGEFQNGAICWSPSGGTKTFHGPNPFYTFKLDNFFVDQTRSWHEDTIHVYMSVRLGDKPYDNYQFMGNNNNGPVGVGLTIGPIEIVDPSAPVTFHFQIDNTNVEGDLSAQMKAIGDWAHDKFANSGDPWAEAIAGGYEVLSQLFPGIFQSGACDGMVAMDQFVVSPAVIASWVMENGTGWKCWSKFYKGYDSPSGCNGTNSEYTVTWCIERW